MICAVSKKSNQIISGVNSFVPQFNILICRLVDSKKNKIFRMNTD